MSRSQDLNWQRKIKGPALLGSLIFLHKQACFTHHQYRDQQLGEGASGSGVTVFTSTGIPGVCINPTMNLLPYI